MSEVMTDEMALQGSCLSCQEFQSCGTVYKIKKDNLRTKNIAYEYFKTNKDYCPDYAMACDPKA